MNLSDLEQKRIAIWGLGREGRATYDFLRAHFPDNKLILIDNEQPHDSPQPVILQENIASVMDDIDLVIKAPGISLYHPLVEVFRQHDITITSASNIWLANRPQSTGRGKIIAVTGSNGKSTCCALLHHILTGLGLKVELGGNIGTPLLSLTDDADYYIIELSSYQTADLNAAPDIALLLNLFPEHIHWHQTHKQYFADKCHLIRTGAQTVILNSTDPLTREFITDLPPGTIWFNDPSAIHKQDDQIMDGKKILGPCNDITLPGGHNHENICAALTLCKRLGLELTQCFALAATFGGLAHRLENLGPQQGITCINDSISTTPEATIAALKSFAGRDITLICGGQDRGQNFGQLAEYINAYPEIIPITAYETGHILSKILHNAKSADDLTMAVKIAQKITPGGGIILLSPAAPSYDGFRNFEERGWLFKKLITGMNH